MQRMSVSAWLVLTKFAGGGGKALEDLRFLWFLCKWASGKWERCCVPVHPFLLQGKVPYYTSRGPGFFECVGPIASCSRQQMPGKGEPMVGGQLFLPRPVSVSPSWSLSFPSSQPINLFFFFFFPLATTMTIIE